MLDTVLTLAQHLRLIVGGALFVGVVTLGASYLIKPTFTARTLLLPPQQQGSLVASALSSLGSLAGLAGGAGGVKSPLDQYVTLLQSTNIADRIIARFKLAHVYDDQRPSVLRTELAANLRVAAGRRDGLITIEVDDHDPQRSADMANAFVDELRRLTSVLAVTEAQQRKLFFEAQLNQTKSKLAQAQVALQGSGFSPNALKAEPRAAAESYARLKAELTSAEVRLQTLSSSFSAQSPEVMQLSSTVAALRGQLDKLERTSDASGDADYVGKYREFKYQETLFELFARQYELARVDESREGSLIQVVDAAQVPDRKSKPKRAIVALVATLLAGLALTGFVLIRQQLRRVRQDPERARKLTRLGALLRGRRDPDATAR
ncbi:MAG: lipopolysaccharide biosynthesis protein [Burkholderiaceae bacterium]|nr:lipopolysaccharide biosynthesis protein [Burkholderiaceae bacterium]